MEYTAVIIKAAPDKIELSVLRAITEGTGGFGRTEWHWTFAAISRSTGLPRDYVRAACRSLTDQGRAHYRGGLFTEEGEVAGAGYAATRAGIEYLEATP